MNVFLPQKGVKRGRRSVLRLAATLAADYYMGAWNISQGIVLRDPRVKDGHRRVPLLAAGLCGHTSRMHN